MQSHLISWIKDYPEWMLMSGFGCCLMFLVCGLPGNIITILALARCKKVIFTWLGIIKGFPVILGEEHNSHLHHQPLRVRPSLLLL